MKLSEIGEFGFIERFTPHFNNLLTPGTRGIGDDCAILPMNESEEMIVTTDMLVEDIHFLRNKISAQDLGHKSLAVNLSDIAAMGGRPVGSFLSIAIPKTIEVEYLDALMDGYYQLSQKFSVPLLGGDTTRSIDKLTLNITVIGQIKRGQARLRSMAQTNDVIAVSGPLGNSAAGLQSILHNYPNDELTSYLIKSHNHPMPHINEGLWLAQQTGVNAMMDVSDGIASDLKHILHASGKGAVIELSDLPISSKMKEFAQKYDHNAYELATSGGEDYCLLLTINDKMVEKITQEFQQQFGHELRPIGRISQEKGLRYELKGKSVENLKNGFNHFI